MNAELYVEILRTTLLPFLSSKFPMGHRLMQDMTLNMFLTWLNNFFETTTLIGGKCHQKAQI